MVIASSCPICFEDMKSNNAGALSCGHTYCYTCISEWLTKFSPMLICPICKSDISSSNVIKLFFHEDDSKAKKKASELGEEPLKLNDENSNMDNNGNRNRKEKNANENQRRVTFPSTPSSDEEVVSRRKLPKRSCTPHRR
uniref:RING-type E3 ubiquitin transferase n=1 Tax=Strongyloides papillosus TaxID=174720 RepID=A0A0N5BGV1_STREA